MEVTEAGEKTFLAASLAETQLYAGGTNFVSIRTTRPSENHDRRLEGTIERRLSQPAKELWVLDSLCVRSFFLYSYFLTFFLPPKAAKSSSSICWSSQVRLLDELATKAGRECVCYCFFELVPPSNSTFYGSNIICKMNVNRQIDDCQLESRFRNAVYVSCIRFPKEYRNCKT